MPREKDGAPPSAGRVRRSDCSPFLIPMTEDKYWCTACGCKVSHKSNIARHLKNTKHLKHVQSQRYCPVGSDHKRQKSTPLGFEVDGGDSGDSWGGASQPSDQPPTLGGHHGRGMRAPGAEVLAALSAAATGVHLANDDRHISSGDADSDAISSEDDEAVPDGGGLDHSEVTVSPIRLIDVHYPVVDSMGVLQTWTCCGCCRSWTDCWHALVICVESGVVQAPGVRTIPSTLHIWRSTAGCSRMVPPAMTQCASSYMML